MNPLMTRLDNGFTIVTDPVPYVGTVTIGVWVRAGSRNETARTNGLCHFLEHLLFKGTQTRSAFEIAAEIENLGGTLDGFTDCETTAYYVQTGARHWPVAVTLLGDLLTRSVFPEAEIERDRAVVLQEIDRYADDPEAVLGDVLQATLYPGQPLGRPILGTAETVASFTRAHLQTYLADQYLPERMVLVASGRVEHAEVAALADTVFGDLPTREALLVAPARLVGGQARVSRDFEQNHYALAFEGLGFDHPDLPGLRHVANILGGGLTSRLFQEIRERRGLAYDVHAEVEVYADTGFLTIEAATAPERLDDLTGAIDQELERARTGFAAAELARSKEQLRFLLASSQESTFGRAQRLARDALFRGRVRGLDEIEAAIDGVTIETLDRIGQTVLSAPPSLCVVGPRPKTTGRSPRSRKRAP